MAKNDNLKDFLTDVANAIREKKGTTDLINPQDFSAEIASIKSGGGGDLPSRPQWTGHADAGGLMAIGWTDDDIAYYQENGVNWNEEDDDYHKVTDDNKALYGVLTADNISTYKERIVYLPKIDTSAKTSMSSMFMGCYSLVAIPQLDTQNVTNMNLMFNACYSLVSIPQLNTQSVTNMSQMFYNCYSLVSIPQLNTQSVTNTSSMFYSCYSLVSIPQLDTQNVTNMNRMFYNCYSLVSIPQLNTQSVTNTSSMFYYCYSLVSIPQLNTQSVTDMSNMFYNCYSLVSIPQLDTQTVMDMYRMFYNCYSLVSIPQLNTQSVTNMSQMFYNCYSLVLAKVQSLKTAISFNGSALLNKESLLYIINNEASTSAITITLKAYAYTRLSTDADIVAALANHPNISLASA